MQRKKEKSCGNETTAKEQASKGAEQRTKIHFASNVRQIGRESEIRKNKFRWFNLYRVK